MKGVADTLAAPIVDAVLTTLDLRKAMAQAAEKLGTALSANSSVVILSQESTKTVQPPVEWTAYEPDPSLDSSTLKLARYIQQLTLPLPRALVVRDVKKDPMFGLIQAEIMALDVGAVLAMTARCHGVPNATIILYRDITKPRWTDEEVALLEYVAHFFGLAVNSCLAAKEQRINTDSLAVQASHASTKADEPSWQQPKAPDVLVEVDEREFRYQRLVEHSDAIIFHVDAEHVITFISKRALDFFGIASEDFVAGTPVHWFDLVHLDDRERIRRRALEIQEDGSAFDEEYRVINHLTGQQRWLLTKFVPVYGDAGGVIGWDGFGIDITARREAQEALDAQSKKVRALYTVSSAIRGYLDPANIASRGVAALCEATGADAGLCYLYENSDAEKLSLVAHHGFSADFGDSIEDTSNLPSLSTYVAEHGQSVVVPDMRTDPRASRILSDQEGIRSAVLVPISVEEETLGTIGLFNRTVSKFDGGDVMLVAAAANQIGLASRQANLFSAYRKQTKNLAALYRISHELSGFLSLDEIFQNAFTIIRDELDLRRLWLGLLNETGTRIVGQAAYGPGWKRRLVEMNVEIEGRDHPIAQVVTTRKAMIIEQPEESLRRFGTRRFFSKFAIRAIGLVPLIAGGQVLGVLAFQPDDDDSKLDQEEITLISSLASEIAAIVLTKRLEERIAQGEKMRTAGLLAAGIAHNFNNLLQAILGQASLLEMQYTDDARVSRSSKTITQAATKGAALVKQLISFANLEEPVSELCDVNAVVERGVESLSRNMEEGHVLKLELGDELPRAHADPGHIVRILSTLVKNASEAMSSNGVVHIFSDRITVDRESPHYEVPFGEYVRIGVRDVGIGMDRETQKRCFEPFFTTKNLDPNSGLGLTGAGLGLAAAYALARKNGGRLVVESKKGRGSVFTLYLPVTEEEQELDSDSEEAPLNGKVRKRMDSNQRVRANASLKLVEDNPLKIKVEQYDKGEKATFGTSGASRPRRKTSSKQAGTSNERPKK